MSRWKYFKWLFKCYRGGYPVHRALRMAWRDANEPMPF